MSDDLRDLYQEIILDHGRNPRNFRHPPDCDRSAEGDNPLCGDRLTVYLKLDGEGAIEDIAFQGRGCAISMASASMMTEMVQGRSETAVRALFESFHRLVAGEGAVEGDGEALDKLVALSGVRRFPMRVKCATLPWHAMTAAMDGAASVTTE